LREIVELAKFPWNTLYQKPCKSKYYWTAIALIKKVNPSADQP
jgi:hypothetical protein